MADISRLMASLNGKQERLAILEQIVEHLDLEERRALSLICARRNGPLAALPLEIVIDFLARLPILDTWRLQSVSKQWRSVLSSDRVVNAALARWNTHDSSDGARASTSTNVEFTRSKIRHMQAFRRGRPFTFTVLPTALRLQNHSDQANRVFALKAHRLACIETDSEGIDTVVVHELVTGALTRCYGTARERILSVALTTTFVAFLNYSGKMYVQDLVKLDSDRKEFRLPSASIAAFAADGDLCAVVFQAEQSGNFTTALYDHTRGSLKAFSASCPRLSDEDGQRYPAPHIALLNSRQRTLDLFTSLGGNQHPDRDSPNPRGPTIQDIWKDLFIHHTRYSCTGNEILASYYRCGCLGAGMSPAPSRDTHDDFHGDLHPTGMKSIYVFKTRGVLFQRQTPTDRFLAHFKLYLCFNQEKARFEERNHSGDQVYLYYSRNRSTFRDTAMWKDINIQAAHMYFEFQTEAVAPEEDTDETSGRNQDPDPEALDESNPVPFHRYRLQTKITIGESTGTPNPEPTGFIPLVNDTFLVAIPNDAQHRRIRVLCFDEELQCAGFKNTGLWEGTQAVHWQEKHPAPALPFLEPPYALRGQPSHHYHLREFRKVDDSDAPN